MKTAKTFRFSSQALESLHYLVDVTGSNETAIIEIALAHFSQTMRGQKLSGPGKVDPVSKEGGRKRHKKKGHASAERSA